MYLRGGVELFLFEQTNGETLNHLNVDIQSIKRDCQITRPEQYKYCNKDTLISSQTPVHKIKSKRQCYNLSASSFALFLSHTLNLSTLINECVISLKSQARESQTLTAVLTVRFTKDSWHSTSTISPTVSLHYCPHMLIVIPLRSDQGEVKTSLSASQ